MRIASSFPALMLAGLVLAGCHDDGISPQRVAEAKVASVTAGGFSQDAPAGTALPEDLTITAWDSAHVPVPGARVTWKVESADGGRLSQVQGVTGSDGTAHARWTLGSVPGAYVVHATVAGRSAEFDGIATGPAVLLNFSSPTEVLAPGASFQLGVKAYDALSQRISRFHAAFASSDTSVVSIDSLGQGIARKPGSAVITVRVESLTGSVTVSAAERLRARAVSVGPRQGCALASDGTAYCWTQGMAMPLAGGHRFTSLSEGGNVACGLDAGGAAYCWGSNEHGQLGSAGGPSSEVPVQVAGGLRFASISAGAEHVCGVTVEQAAYCWGDGAGGRLGTGSTDDAPAPTPVAGGITFREVSPGLNFTCGIDTDGNAFCWGQQSNGQLGQGGPSPGPSATASAMVPALVTGGHAFSTITAGTYTACGVTPQGALHCWGATEIARTGLPRTTSASPQEIASGTVFTSVKAAWNHLCGMTAGGSLLCWGDNYVGQLGDSTRTTTAVPVAAGNQRSFTSFSVGGLTTCGVGKDGLVYCWGGGSLGNPSDVSGCSDGHVWPIVDCRIRPLPVLIDPAPTAASRSQSGVLRRY